VNGQASIVGASHTDFRSSFESSKRWNPIIKRIVGPYLLRDSTLVEDTTEATDLIVLRAEGVRVACRVRNHNGGYASRYPWDITMTCQRETGSKCEWDKMILGDLGDWFFYGHGNSSCDDIEHWFLVDLGIARPYLRSGNWIKKGPNKDVPGKRCWFYAFNAQRFPISSAIIAQRVPVGSF